MSQQNNITDIFRFLKGVVLNWEMPQTEKKTGKKVYDFFEAEGGTETTMMYTGGGFHEALFDVGNPVSIASVVEKNTPISYQWLPYAQCRTSCVTVGDVDVLTGPMSGCPVLSWYDTNGNLNVGHVGTVDAGLKDKNGNEYNALLYKETLKNLPDGCTGFNPFGVWRDVDFGSIMDELEKDKKKKYLMPQFLGLVTTENIYYSIMIFREKKKPANFVVAGCQRVGPETIPGTNGNPTKVVTHHETEYFDMNGLQAKFGNTASTNSINLQRRRLTKRYTQNAATGSNRAHGAYAKKHISRQINRQEVYWC